MSLQNEGYIGTESQIFHKMLIVCTIQSIVETTSVQIKCI